MKNVCDPKAPAGSITRRFCLELRTGFLVPTSADKKEGDTQEHPWVMSPKSTKGTVCVSTEG